MLHSWICVCIFFSGISALIYEITWLRVMGFTLGSSAIATSLALAVFLLGLALGAYVGGRLADKYPATPLRLYGVVELSIGISAVVLTPLLMKLPEMLLAMEPLSRTDLTTSAFLIGAISCIVLVPPTMLMGATLPIVLKQVSLHAPAQKIFGLIYGLNTLGAVFGSLIAAFIGFSYLGLSGTVMLAALINAVIGLANLLLPRKVLEQASSAPEPAGSADADTVGICDRKYFPLGTITLLAFSSGYLSLTLEVVWVRMLRFYNGSLTYSFTVMIATFLLSLALGSIIYEKLIFGKDKTVSDQILRFVRVQHLAGIACAGSLIGIPIVGVLKGYSLIPGGIIFFEPVKGLAELAITSAVCIVVPATLIGILFPVLGALSSMAHQKMASRVGVVYAANTLGCVCGSILTGLVFVPVIGSYDSFQLALLFAIVCSSIAVWSLEALDKRRRVLMAVVPVVLAAAFFLFVKIPFSSFIHFPPPQKLLFYGEDTTGTVFVVDYPQIDAKQLTVNGSCLATTVLPSRRYMRLLGHLPMLLHRNPKNVMIACFGTGTTCGAVGVHPTLESLQIVELSPLVIKNARFFADSNHRVLENPKVRVNLGDARHFLLKSDNVFDVISMEPPPPADAGMVNLYTTEFYSLVNRRLSKEGIFGQWVPMHEQPETVWKMMVASACKVFPHVTVWLPNSGEALLMASKSPIEFDADVVRSRMKNPEVSASLSDVGIDSAEDLLACSVFGDEPLRSYLSNSPDVTDDRPTLEFFLPYLGEFLSDRKLLSFRNDQTAIVLKGEINQKDYERSREALSVSLTGNGDKKKMYAKLDELKPGNKWFAFLKKLDSEK
ncbi:MAG: fused MFS/spermidine synthase [Candidatus Obscuribacterales bacterium]|nr:fused MFS/spermidine synthase [Candidatus Obscuribacterales bacterium]